MTLQCCGAMIPQQPPSPVNFLAHTSRSFGGNPNADPNSASPNPMKCDQGTVCFRIRQPSPMHSGPRFPGAPIFSLFGTRTRFLLSPLGSGPAACLTYERPSCFLFSPLPAGASAPRSWSGYTPQPVAGALLYSLPLTTLCRLSPPPFITHPSLPQTQFAALFPHLFPRTQVPQTTGTLPLLALGGRLFYVPPKQFSLPSPRPVAVRPAHGFC
jgi:hypothetical protein